MSDQGKPEGNAAALLEQLQRKLSNRGLKRVPLFRVVEVTRGPDGRLSRQGQIWHDDLGHARRFGRALAANSSSHEVLVADVNGGVIEQFATVGALRPPLGWGGWRDVVLPPAPAVRRPNAALRRVPPAPPRPPAEAATLPPALSEIVDLPLQPVDEAVAAPAARAPAEPPRPTPAPPPPEASEDGLATPLAGEIGLTLP